jgi:branched-chain amino acid transport system ATP-binding protein
MRIENIRKSYGAHEVLRDVTFEVADGSIHALIGPNGAGKSTLFGVISGEHRPESGSIWLNDRDIVASPVGERVSRYGMVRTFQVARTFAGLTVGENIETAILASHGRGYSFWSVKVRQRLWSQAQESLARVGLDRIQDALVSEISHGDKKRLEIGMALARGAKILFLDEPTAGMSAEDTSETLSLIKDLWSAGGLTVLLTEHDMDFVFGLAEEITVLHRGTVVCTDAPAVVRARADVQELYLGGGELV